MGSGLTDYGAGAWLSQMFGIASGPPGFYVALCTDEPGAAMDGALLGDIEPTAGTYRRQRIGVGAASWGLADTYVTNTVALTYGTAGSDWGYIGHFALCTAPSGGQVFAWGEFLDGTFIGAGCDVSVSPGGLVLALTSLDSPIAV